MTTIKGFWKAAPWLALGAVILWTILSIRSCTRDPDPKYWMKVAVHEEAMKAAAVAHQQSLAEINALKTDNALKDIDIIDKAKQIWALGSHASTVANENAGLAAENKRLREDAAAAIAASPALQALIANFDLQIKGKDEQIFDLTMQLALVGIPLQTGVDAKGQPIIEYQPGTITWDMNQKYLNQVGISEKWERDYNTSQGLLATEHSLRLTSEKKGKTMTLVAQAEVVVLTGVGAYFGGKALGHALKLW